MFTREKVIEIARSWLGTKFKFQGRIKKNSNNNGGVDCLGLILCICDELGYTYNDKPLSYYDNIIYSKKPDFSILKEKFSQFFTIKTVDNIDIGDIVLKQVSKDQFHLMIYTEKTFIHASAVTFNVVEHRVDDLNNCIVYSMFK